MRHQQGAEDRLMLDTRLETLCYIIAKAREFQAKEEVVIPETPSSPSDDWALQVLADHVDDMTLQEIRSTVEDLDPAGGAGGTDVARAG